MKRFCVFSALLLLLLVGLGAGFFYFFVLNNHGQWLSRQIEESTGYQVHFERITSNDWTASSFSVSGLSVGVDQQELLSIDKVNITIAALNLWQRELQMELLELAGVQLLVDTDWFNKRSMDLSSAEKEHNSGQLLPWSRLQVNKLRIRAANADISNMQQRLRLRQATLSEDNLLIIEQHKLATGRLAGELQFAFKNLYLQSKAGQAVTLKNFSVNSDFDLAAVQASLTARMEQGQLSFSEQAKVNADNLLLKLQLNKNQVHVTHLSAQLFSGELQLQAKAGFIEPLFSTSALSIEQLSLLSLSAKNMHIKVPELQPEGELGATNKVLHGSSQKEKLLIKTLFLKQLDVQNLTVSSEAKQLPLTIKALNAHLQDVYLLRNQALFSLSEKSRQSGVFTLQVAYLQWADSITEQLQMAGSFTDNAQKLLLLKDLLRFEEK